MYNMKTEVKERAKGQNDIEQRRKKQKLKRAKSRETKTTES